MHQVDEDDSICKDCHHAERCPKLESADPDFSGENSEAAVVEYDDLIVGCAELGHEDGAAKVTQPAPK